MVHDRIETQIWDVSRRVQKWGAGGHWWGREVEVAETECVARGRNAKQKMMSRVKTTRNLEVNMVSPGTVLTPKCRRCAFRDRTRTVQGKRV